MRLTREQATQINQWAESGFTADDEDITSSELYEMLQTSPNIIATSLNFTREGLLLFANIIATSPSLTTLDMGNNGIGANAAAFGTSIATLDSLTLTTLDMRYNDIGANEADFIKNIAHLTNLDWLYGCNEAMFGQVKESHLALQTAVKNILSDPLFSSMNEDLASIVVEYLGNMLVDHTDM